MATRPAAKSTAKTRSTKTKTAAKVADVTDATDAADAPVMKTKDLIEAVAPNVSLKKKDLRPVMEAIFKAMGEAIDDGKSLAIPPLGKVLVKRARKGENADTIVLRLRRQHGGAPAPESLAEDDE